MKLLEKVKCKMGDICSLRSGEECTKNCYYNTETVKTNYEKIVSKSVYELADWLAEILNSCGNDYCGNCPLWDCCYDQESDNIEDWLNQPAK